MGVKVANGQELYFLIKKRYTKSVFGRGGEDTLNNMEEAIKQTIKYLEKVPAEFQSSVFPIILEHQLLQIRRKAWIDKNKK